MKWDTDSFISFLFCSNEYIFLKDLINEHFVRTTSKYVILFSFLIFFFQNRDLQFILKKLDLSIYPESCSSSLYVVTQFIKIEV